MNTFFTVYHSQSLLTLSAIEEMLKREPVLEAQPDVRWQKGLHYFSKILILTFKARGVLVFLFQPFFKVCHCKQVGRCRCRVGIMFSDVE